MKRERRFPIGTRSLKKEIRENQAVFVVYITLRLIVILAMVLSALRGDFENVFICALVLVLFLIPAFIEKNFGIELPSVLQIVIMLHIFAAEILGELSCYYVQYKYWDTLLHTVWGFLCAAVGFSLVDILNRDNRTRVHLSPAYLAVAAFCFSMTIGVLWEFFEFGMDYLFKFDMQKDTVVNTISSVMLDPANSNIPIVVENIRDVAVNGESLGFNGYLDIGLFDTMKDLFVNFIGAVVFSVIGFFSRKKGGKSKILEQLVPQLKEPEGEI